jgi:hypothetical protein
LSSLLLLLLLWLVSYYDNRERVLVQFLSRSQELAAIIISELINKPQQQQF